jgi:hypothetical protein
VIGPRIKELEASFQLKLADSLSREGHQVALHDAGTKAWPRRFSSTGLCPDLLVETNPAWALHDAIPVLAIEAKVGFKDTISDVWDGVLQLMELKRNESEITYKIEGVEVRPVLYLFSNPCLLEWDVATYWRTVGRTGEHSCCTIHFTRALVGLLVRFNAGLLGKNFNFMYEGQLNGYQFSRVMSLRRSARQLPLYRKLDKHL